MSVSIYGKRERGVIRRRRIIGVSTMVLAVLLLALPLYTRANIGDWHDVTTPFSVGAPVTAGGTAFTDKVIAKVGYHEGTGDVDHLTLMISLPDGVTYDGTNGEAMAGFTVGDYTANGTPADNRPWNAYLNKIEHVIIGEGVTTIGANAFKDNSWNTVPDATGATGTSTSPLEDVSLPKTLTRIEAHAFENSPVQTVDMKDTSLTFIGNSAFHRSGITDASLPDTMTEIEYDAFYNADALTGIKLFQTADQSALRTIGERAFSECNNLAGSLTFPDNLQTIGAKAFANDEKLTGALTLPNKVNAIGEGAFHGCKGLNGDLTLSENLKEIPKQAFSNCEALKGTLKIPAGVTKIGEGAFENCAALQGTKTEPVTIPATVTEIGAGAFKGTTTALFFRIHEDAPVTVTKATDENRSFDASDVLLYPAGNTTWEADITYDSTGQGTWNEYNVVGVNQSGAEVDYPAFHTQDERSSLTGIGTAKAEVTATGTNMPNNGKGFRVVIRELTNQDTDVLKPELTSTSALKTDDLYHPYDISLYDRRSFFTGVSSPAEVPVTEDFGTIKITLPVPDEIAQEIRDDVAEGQTDTMTSRLKVYTTPAAGATSTAKYEPVTITDATDTTTANATLQVSFEVQHLSTFAFVYTPYEAPVLKKFYVDDMRTTTNGSVLLKGVEGGGSPIRSSFAVVTDVSDASASFEGLPTGYTSTDGFRLVVSADDGEDIRGLSENSGEKLLIDQYRMFAPCDIKLYHDDGTNTTGPITEGFGKINIYLPIPEDMDTEKGKLEVIGYRADTGSGAKLDHWTVGNGLYIGMMQGRSGSKYASFTVDHFSEFALYYVMDRSASNTSTTSSTASTASSTGSSSANAATTGNSGGTGSSGASNTGATNSGATNSGTNTGTTGASSATGASGASGGSGSTNSGTGSSGSSGTDMPRTGDADFYRMTISVALLLFGAYELISTIRIRKRRG